MSQWSGLSLPNMAIGQGLAVTPLQILQAYNTIANGGVLVPLKLVVDDTDTGAGVRHRRGARTGTGPGSLRGCDADADADVGGGGGDRSSRPVWKVSPWPARPAQPGNPAMWGTNA